MHAANPSMPTIRVLVLLAALAFGASALSGCNSSSSGGGGGQDDTADNGNGGGDDVTVENHWNVMNWNEGEWQ